MRSVVTQFNSLPLDSVLRRCLSTTTGVAREILGKSHLALNDFASLISHAASELLESLSRRSQQLSSSLFGSCHMLSRRGRCREAGAGLEPASAHWKCAALALNYHAEIQIHSHPTGD